MIARVFEDAGLSTTVVALVKEHAARVKAPRSLAVPFPYGSALGRANDPAFQHKVISAALDLLQNNDTPVMGEFPESGEGPVNLLQASAVQVDGAKSLSDPADELTALRTYYERWVENQGGRTLVGLTGVPQRRFRGIVRYLQDYAQGKNGETPERPEAFQSPSTSAGASTTSKPSITRPAWSSGPVLAKGSCTLGSGARLPWAAS